MFVRESGAGLLLTALLLVSTVALVLESTTRLLDPVRFWVGSLVSPLRYVAETPYLLAADLGDTLSSRESLIERNAGLQQQILELSQVSQQFLALRRENERLRQLLGSRRRVPHDVLVAELVGVMPAPNRWQVVIDKGAAAGIYIGQAVLDSEGLFGQVVAVDQFTATVLLLADRLHAVPIEVNRTGLRGIAAGTGRVDQLLLEDVPTTADIREGDLVVSSGLGGRFPQGYPVGNVSSVLKQPGAAQAVVSVRPAARLDRTRHVLVVFPPAAETESEAALDVQTPAEEAAPASDANAGEDT